jgi:uncharacterized protein (DUF2164 family)
MIHRSIDHSRKKTRQLVALAQIDQSIVRERTRDYLTSEERRIKNEMMKAQNFVRESVAGTFPHGSLEQKMYEARRKVEKKAEDIKQDVMSSSRRILRRRELMQKNYATIFEDAQRKILSSKEKLGNAQVALNSAVSDRLREVKDSEDSIKKGLDAMGSRIRDVRSKSENVVRKPEQGFSSDSRKAAIGSDFTWTNVQSARNNFRIGSKHAKDIAAEAGRQVSIKGQTSLKQMQTNFLDSKALFEVDVRFAQAKIREASRKSKSIGIQMTSALAHRRKIAIERARARRKAQSIRNALALIRT